MNNRKNDAIYEPPSDPTFNKLMAHNVETVRTSTHYSRFIQKLIYLYSPLSNGIELKLDEDRLKRRKQCVAIIQGVISPRSFDIVYDHFYLIHDKLTPKFLDATVAQISFATMTKDEHNMFSSVMSSKIMEVSDMGSKTARLQLHAKEQGLWESRDDEALTCYVCPIGDDVRVSVSYMGHTERTFGECSTPSIALMIEACCSGHLQRQLSHPVIDTFIDEDSDEECDPVGADQIVDTLEYTTDAGEKSYVAKVTTEAGWCYSSGSFSTKEMAYQSANQRALGVNRVPDLIIEYRKDVTQSAHIRHASYYTSDSQWNSYVTLRSPYRLHDVMKLVLPIELHRRVVAPCDGAGVVALACELLGRKCYSSDVNALSGRVRWVNVVPESWENTAKIVDRHNDVVLLSHCAEMCPTIVSSYLDKCERVIYYGKEMMFEGMSRMTQISVNLWTSFYFREKIFLDVEQASSPLYLGQVLKYPSIGIVSVQGLKALKTLFLYGANTRFRYFTSDLSERKAFSEMLAGHRFVEEKRDVDVILAYSNSDCKAARRYQPRCIVLDMRTGHFYYEVQVFAKLPWSGGRCRLRTIYRCSGEVIKLHGKGVGIEITRHNSYVWFDEPGEKRLIVTSRNQYSNILILVERF